MLLIFFLLVGFAFTLLKFTVLILCTAAIVFLSVIFSIFIVLPALYFGFKFVKWFLGLLSFIIVYPFVWIFGGRGVEVEEEKDTEGKKERLFEGKVEEGRS
jgi:membrane protein implicated in regulation of membrane protease activity